MGESRTELISWINDLLQVNYTKVEQCGTGGAYCQIMDSIFGDVPMTRVKMNAKHEYEFIANFKVLQNVFRAHKIEKPIPVDKLVKCKMQDNLEFLQWIKRYWDANYGGQPYDPVARRKGAPVETPATIAPLAPSTKALGVSTSRAGGKTPISGHRATSTQPSEVIQLRQQLAEMGAHLENLEKERDFYFAKLREIEILVQAQMESSEAEGQEALPVMQEIQKILYSTEDGFEVPDQEAADEEETF